MEAHSTIIRWQGASGSEREHVVVVEDEKRGIRVDSVYLSRSGSDAFAVHYRLFCDAEWTLLKFEGYLIGAEQKVSLLRDAHGQWTNETGEPVTALQGTTDIDLSISPFTNTLPIRRLKLQLNQSADLMVAYVSFPDLAIFADPQRYTRVGSKRYLFESVDTEFKAEFDVDDQGFVLNYPDLFLRI